MCIVFYTLTHPGYKLILASNRDEYLDRPTLPAAWHTFTPLDLPASVPTVHSSPPGAQVKPWVLSGRDEGSPVGGTWLGMTRDLRIAVLTNIRITPVPTPPNAPSRGLLLKDFLAPPPHSSNISVHDHLTEHQSQADQYEGFNLLLFHLHPPRPRTQMGCLNVIGSGTWGKPEVGYLSNRPGPTLTNIHSPSRIPSPLPDDNGETPKSVGKCVGLSNTPLSQPWPKVTRGQENMSQTLHEWAEGGEDEDQLIERMMEMLQQTKPLDSIGDLSQCTCLHPVRLGSNPDTKIQEGEKGRWYGTRVTTVILVKEDGEVTFVERDIFVQDGQGEAVRGTEERRFKFQAEVLE